MRKTDEPTATETGAATRRAMFAGAGAVGAAAVLAACGTDNSGYDPYTGETPGGGTQTPGGPAETPGGQDAQSLVEAGEVEVGGGVVVNEEVVVTQPADGDWRAFSATCTHDGCIVNEISNGTINCPCHGSKYSIEDGSVVAAAYGGDPAGQDPLPTVEVQESDGWIVRA